MLRLTVAALAAAAVVSCAGVAGATSKGKEGYYFLHKIKSEDGKTCFEDWYMHGKAKAASEEAAKMQASAAWSSWVSAKYGPAWAAWDAAGNSTLTCVKGEWYHSCYAHARPCRY